MNWEDLNQSLAPSGLFVMGVLHEDDDTLALIGAGRGMWPVFTQSQEYREQVSNPLDQWSKRTMTSICTQYDAQAHFPSDGPPYLPFIAWAKQTGRFWQSPTGMLVHDVAGLMISIRAALRLPGHLPLPSEGATSPCQSCMDRPCTSACPVGALSVDTAYDVPACKAHLDTSKGQDCMSQGCLSRRACPVSEAFKRDPIQSAFHMRSFNPS